MLDRKHRWMIGDLHARFERGDFSESDILAFLILAREVGTNRSVIHEFGDFVAHREKVHGKVWTFLQNVKGVLESPPELRPAVIDTVFSPSAIEQSVNTVFVGLDLPSLTPSRTAQITVVIASLLQDVRMVDKNGTPWGSLAFGFNANLVGAFGCVTVGRAGIVFPAIAVPNAYFKSSYTDSETYDFFTGVVQVECRKGVLSYTQVTAT